MKKQNKKDAAHRSQRLFNLTEGVKLGAGSLTYAGRVPKCNSAVEEKRMKTALGR